MPMTNENFLRYLNSTANDNQIQEQLSHLFAKANIFTLNSGRISLQQLANNVSDDNNVSTFSPFGSRDNLTYQMIQNITSFGHPAFVAYFDNATSFDLFKNFMRSNNSWTTSFFTPPSLFSSASCKKYSSALLNTFLQLTHESEMPYKDDFLKSNIVTAFILVCACVGSWVILIVMIILSSTPLNVNFARHIERNALKNGNNSNKQGIDNDIGRDGQKAHHVKDGTQNKYKLLLWSFASTIFNELTKWLRILFHLCKFNNSNTNSWFFSVYLWFAVILFSVMLSKANNDVFVKQYSGNYQDGNEFYFLMKNSVWFNTTMLILQILCDFNWLEIVYYLKFKSVPKNVKKYYKKTVILIGLVLILLNLISAVFFMFLTNGSRIAFSLLYTVKLLIYVVFIVFGIIPFAYKQYTQICLLDKFQTNGSKDNEFDIEEDDDENGNETGDEEDLHHGGGLKTFQNNKLLSNPHLQSLTFYKQNIPLLIYNFVMMCFMISLQVYYIVGFEWDNNWLVVLLEFSEVVVTFNAWVFIGLLEKQERSYTKESTIGRKIIFYNEDDYKNYEASVPGLDSIRPFAFESETSSKHSANDTTNAGNTDKITPPVRARSKYNTTEMRTNIGNKTKKIGKKLKAKMAYTGHEILSFNSKNAPENFSGAYDEEDEFDSESGLQKILHETKGEVEVVENEDAASISNSNYTSNEPGGIIDSLGIYHMASSTHRNKPAYPRETPSYMPLSGHSRSDKDSVWSDETILFRSANK
ncbi:hypothetical protein ACO0QE_000619 [Hanseniaspora vineae]